MKIIKEGKWHQGWKEQVTCSIEGCGAVLEVDHEDIIPAGYKNLAMIKIHCPSCDQEFLLNDKIMQSVPPKIKKMIQSKMTENYNYGEGRD